MIEKVMIKAPGERSFTIEHYFTITTTNATWNFFAYFFWHFFYASNACNDIPTLLNILEDSSTDHLICNQIV